MHMVISCFSLFFFFFQNSSSYADLSLMTKADMKAMTGQAGFADFSITGDTARIFLDIHLETWTDISSFKAGYYEKNGSSGWDQDWTEVQIGSESEVFEIDGVVLMADFSDGIGTSSQRLQRIIFGTNRAQGDITARMNAYTGVYNDALTGGTGTPVYLDRETVSGTTADSSTTFKFDSNISETQDMGLYFILSLEGEHPGIQVVSGYDEGTIKNSFNQGEWWDSP